MNDVKFYKRFSRNWLSVAGLAIIGIMFVIAILGYLISSDSSPFANEQMLPIAAKSPMFKVKIAILRKNKEIEPASFLKTMRVGKESSFSFVPIDSFRITGDSITLTEYSNAGKDGLIQTRYHVVDICFPLKNKKIVKDKDDHYHFTDWEKGERIISSSECKKLIIKEHIKQRTFLLGTDRFGRDLLSRLIIGTRISFSVGFISVFISLLIGISMGMAAGYYRGFTDSVISWFVNVVWSVPTLLMVLSITLVLGKGFWQVFLAVGLTMWVEVARVVRGQTLALREKEFIEAARALGFGDFRIIIRHILPNIVGTVVIISAGNFASAILMEAGLSFLGIGVQPPVPSWGNIIKDHYGYIILDQPFLAILPGLAIMLLVLAFNFIGNGLRDAFDTKMN